MTDAELEAVREREALAPPGPWEWDWGYELSQRHWCLVNPASTETTIDHHLVLYTTQEFTSWVLDPEGKHTRLDRLPSFQFIAHSRADIPALLSHVDFLEGVIHDLILDRDGYEAGRQAERREVLALLERLCGHFRGHSTARDVACRLTLQTAIKIIRQRSDTGPGLGAHPKGGNGL